MNTYKVKAFNAIKRLTRFARSKASKKSQPTVSQTQPCINKLYAIDFVQAGAVQKNVTGRYVGMSKSGKFMKFELASFFTLQGVKIHLLCLDKPPVKLLQLKQNLLTISNTCHENQ